MKITDKMRLDWLSKDGRISRWSRKGNYAATNMDSSICGGEGKTVRAAINAAIRAGVRWQGKL